MSGISFGFTKKIQGSKVKLSDSKLRDESTKEEEEETDFVVSVEGQHIKGTKKVVEEKKELVIPLIRKNKWRFEKPEDNVEDKRAEILRKNDAVASSTQENVSEDEALRRQALKELLEEAGGTAEGNNVNYEIPLLLQNHVPAGFEEDDNLDVSLRAEQSTMDDYERCPIEQFGKAMLRGMGWKEEEGIGKTNKKVVDLKEPALRPKGLGLGAERPQANKDTVSKVSTKGSEEAKLVMKIGAYVKINKGPNQGYFGQIQSFDEDNNRVIVKLALNSKLVDVSKFYVDLVPESEYKNKSKVLNYDKYEEYKKVYDERDREREAQKEKSQRERRRDDTDDDSEDPRTNSRGRRRDNDSDSQTNSSRRRRDHDDSEDDLKANSRARRRDDANSHPPSRGRPERRDKSDSDDTSSDESVDRTHRKHTKDKESSKSRKHSKDTESSKSSSRKPSKKHKKEKKKKKKHRRRSSSSSASNSSSRSRSRRRRRD